MEEKQKKTYRTSEIAALIGIHPNTVRLYEEWGMIPRAEREANGYRIFTAVHLEQIKLVRIALRAEVLQNGLRRLARKIIKISARGDYEKALEETGRYQKLIRAEQNYAREAIRIAAAIMDGGKEKQEDAIWTRQEAADCLDVTIDTLRNWELNGLIEVKRKANGYRVYNGEDLDRLRVIRCLRCANYSLMAILRMLRGWEGTGNDPEEIQTALDTPGQQEDIVSVCDRLITSLESAAEDAVEMEEQLKKMKREFGPKKLI
ncbi:MerR family transcriptional regulator [Anaerolentibacter hominis]|uniref:MerR family transcriptional regulator n=1 Tax=Anaerolentibacter hominis TaxID=3079009 RepID=UPI0031B838DE